MAMNRSHNEVQPMRIYKVLDAAEFPNVEQVGDSLVEKNLHILECYGYETEGDYRDGYPSQFTIHTDFPQAYRILTHMKKPTLEPFIVEMEDE